MTRRLIQAAAFFLLPGLFISTFAAIGGIIGSLVQGTFTFAAQAGNIFLLAAVLPLTAIWGRFFCGYLCSFGTMQDAFYWIGGKILPKKFRQKLQKPSRADKALHSVKYGILAFFVLGVWILGLAIPSSISPWGTFGLFTSGNPSVMVTAFSTVGFLLLLTIAAGSLFIERFFCRYLCPLGAVFAIVSKGRLFKIRRRKKGCTRCSLCDRSCSMGLPVSENTSVRSGDCIDCMECLGACPTNCLNAKPQPAVAGATAALAMAGLVYAGRVAANTVPSQNNYVTASTDSTDSDSSSTTAGSSETGSNGASGSSGSGSYFDTGSNSSTGTAGSGSTNSTGSNSTTSAGSGSTTSAGSGSSQDGSAAGSTTLADGTYTGSGTGFRGTTKVQVTVSGGKITDITIQSYQDDEEFFSKASSTIISEILSSQSVDVSTVSGATFSSNGILEAVADAIGEDFTNPNSSMSHGHGHGGRG